MINLILKEWRRSRAKRRHVEWKMRRSQLDRKRWLEEELGLLNESVKPDFFVSTKHGISIGVHQVRSFGRKQFQFEVFRKDPQRGRVQIFSEDDLQDLAMAVENMSLRVKDQRKQWK